MHNPEELMNRLDASITHLEDINLELESLSVAKSVAEREYRVALAKRVLYLKASGFPVSVISDLARGSHHVSNLKLARDTNEALYRVTLDKAQSTRECLQALRSQLTWLRAELTVS